MIDTRKIVTAFATAALLAATGMSLSACNTVAGAGQDVSSVGHDVAHGASATQQDISRSTNGTLATH